MKRTIFVVLLTFSGIFGAFVSPFYGLCIYLWFAYMRPLEWMWGSYWFGAMRPSFCLASAVIISGWMHQEKLFLRSKITLLAALLLGWMIVGYFFAVNQPRAFFWLDIMTKMFILGFVLSGMVNSKQRLTAVIMVLVATLGFYGVKCGLYGIIHPGAKIMQGPGGMLKDNNTFALAFNMILPFMYFAADLVTDKRYKLLLRGVFFLTILSVIFTYSRGGFLGLCVVIVAILIRGKKKLLPLFFLGTIVLVITTMVIPERYVRRISTIFASEENRDESTSGRLHFWRVALIMVNDNPVFGVGTGCYPRAYNRYDFSKGEYGYSRAVHNSFCQILANHGYPGLGLFLLLIFLSAMTCRRIRKLVRGRKDLRWASSCANMFEISFVAYCISGFFLSMGYADLIYHLFFLVAAFEAVARHHWQNNPLVLLAGSNDRVVVDDFAEWLARHDYQPVVATDPESALDLIDYHHPDLVIIPHPSLHGHELLSKLYGQNGEHLVPALIVVDEERANESATMDLAEIQAGYPPIAGPLALRIFNEDSEIESLTQRRPEDPPPLILAMFPQEESKRQRFTELMQSIASQRSPKAHRS